MLEDKDPKTIIETAVDQFANILVASIENKQISDPEEEDKKDTVL